MPFNEDETLGSLWNEQFNPLGLDVPSWTSPQYGGGSGGGTTYPFWLTPSEDIILQDGPPAPVVENLGDDTLPQTAPGTTPTGTTRTGTTPAVEDGSPFDTQTVLIGGGLILAAILLLKK